MFLGDTEKQEMAALLKQEEGLRLRVYRCPEGVLTIGYGRNLETRGISAREAANMLETDINECITDLQRIFPGLEDMGRARRKALVSMRFQLGGNGFRKFSKMIEAINADDWGTAAAEALASRWAEQTPARAGRTAFLMYMERPLKEV